MIRIVFVALEILLCFILLLPVLLLCLLVGLFSTRAKRKVTMFFIRIWARLTMFLAGEKVEVIGREKIPTDKAVLFVGNHNSFFDILTFYGYTPIPVGFVAKKEIGMIPIMSWWMMCVGCLFLDRSSPKAGLKTINKGVEMIKKGDSMFIFPEGTRSKDGTLGHFKPGSLRLAEKSGCPIIPVAMTNTAKVFEGNGYRMHGAKCKMIFGDPIYQEDLPKDSKTACAEFVKAKVQALLDEHS